MNVSRVKQWFVSFYQNRISVGVKTIYLNKFMFSSSSCNYQNTKHEDHKRQRTQEIRRQAMAKPHKEENLWNFQLLLQPLEIILLIVN